MNRRLFFLIGALAAFLLAYPVAATLILSDVSFLPNPPLVPGGQQHMTAKYAILPSGSTTFIRGHELQMQTTLVNARWNIQIVVDGQNAAQQTATGNAAFVNGALLSYPTSRDVSLIVTIDGIVPQTVGNQVVVIQVEEIDNTGNIVPGSVMTINQPVAEQATAPQVTAFPTLTAPVAMQPPSPTKSPGFLMTACIIALGLGCVIGKRHRV